MSLFDDWNNQTPAPRPAATPAVPTNTSNPFGPGSERDKPPSVAQLDKQVEQDQDEQEAEWIQQKPKNPFLRPSLSSLTLEADDIGDEEDEEEEEDVKPKFLLEGINWQQGLSASMNVRQFAVGGGVALLVVSGAGQEQILAWELVSGGRKSTIALASLDGKKNPVHKASICPLGCHVLVSLQNGDNYYANLKANSSGTIRGRGPIQRLKDVVVASVAWDRANRSEDTTGTVLIGSVKGAIWEVSIEAARIKDKKTIKKVHQLNQVVPICGLQAVHASGTRWFVMAATARPTRFYEFIGGPSLEEMFKAYQAPENQSFRELPGDIAHSKLHCFSKGLDTLPTSFMLLSEAGLYIGNLSFDPKASDDKIASRHNMVYFVAKSKTSGEPLINPPLSALETEFHYILLYPSWLIVLSKLNESIVHEQRLDVTHNGQTLGLAYDPARQAIWVYTQHQVFRLVIRNEDGSVWRLFLEKARDGDASKFETAFDMCKTDVQRDKVLTLRADFHYSQGEFEQAARFYAQTKRSFEEVSLMLIDGAKRDALRIYLSLTLANLPVARKTQRTIVAVWLVELFLEQASDFASSFPNQTTNSDHSPLAELQAEFHSFLAQYIDTLRPAKDTIYKLMASHGRDPDYLAFARMNGDHERVVVRYIQRGEHENAVESLASQTHRLHQNNMDPPPSFVELYYKYSPELMERCPAITVDAWIDANFLNPCMLIPSLVRYSQSHTDKDEDQAIRYLEHCVNVQGNQDEAIHNLLIALYAMQTDDTSLREFIQSPSACFDLKYALRVCSENRQKHACVDIYSAMGLFAEAVELALDIDVELAKTNADLAIDAEDRRKLWLRIAQHDIQHVDGKDTAQTVQRALAILRESNALLIEDILPFLPDVVAVGDLKEEICESLEQHNQEIEQLKSEMNEFTETAETIRKEIDQQRDNFLIVYPGHKCDLCGTYVVDQPFYVFPCTHAFHSNCLLDELSRHLGPEQAEKIDMLRSYLDEQSAFGVAHDNANAFQRDQDDDDDDDEAENETFFSGGKLKPFEYSMADREKLAMLDDFVAAACPFCGELMIQSIAEPFITQQEREDAKDWEI